MGPKSTRRLTMRWVSSRLSSRASSRRSALRQPAKVFSASVVTVTSRIGAWSKTCAMLASVLCMRARRVSRHWICWVARFCWGGKNWLSYTGECFKYMKKQLWDNRQTSQHKREIVRLLPYFAKWYYMTGRVALRARSDADALSAASNDYLMYSGYTVMGFHWLRMMDVASERLANGGLSKEDELFYKAKVQTGQFYFDHLLPRANSHFQSALASHKSIMGEDAFNFQQQ